MGHKECAVSSYWTALPGDLKIKTGSAVLCRHHVRLHLMFVGQEWWKEREPLFSLLIQFDFIKVTILK